MRSRGLELALVLVAVGCAGTPQDAYQRHSLSRMIAVEGSSSEFIFQSRNDVVPTEADASPEAVRIRWIAEWLAVRGACTSGHDIVDRRPFGSMEYNPMQADWRYLVRCRAAPVDPQPAQ